jgi:SAM-dependent methyltransferase
MSILSRNVAAPAAGPPRSLEWEEVDCPLCGGRQRHILLEAADLAPGSSGLRFAVVRCSDCGLCYTNPRPSPATIGQFYPDVYRPHRAPRPGRQWRSRSRKERQVLPWHGQGRLLDFGCGGGTYLQRMHRAGWHVLGLDVSAAAVERVRGDLGLPALVGTLPHPALEPASFDVITMLHSLEHVHDPLPVLRGAHRLLTPSGRLLVAAPNLDSLPFRWFGPAWYALDLPRHLIHFTPQTLTAMLQQAGFRPGPVQMVRHSDWVRASARLARRLMPAARWPRWLATKPVSRLAAWYCYLTRRCDCMMVMAER